MQGLSDEIESVLFIAREVMVYQVPPRTSAQGYKAADWNVESFVWKGRLRVLEIGDRCELRLEDGMTGELFAQVTYAHPWTQVEPVLDSSRYFVLRVEGEGGKRASVGMGFAERGEAFDFNVALQTASKRSAQSGGSGNPAAEAPAQPAAPPKDYSLKDGQTFTIKIPGREGKRAGGGAGGAAAPSSGSGSGASGGLFALPPPPPPGRRG